MIPNKLNAGDEIRIVAPALSLSILSKEHITLAEKRLKDMGFKVTYSKNVKEKNAFNSSSIKSRVDDLHEAFRDKNVKLIMTVIGGFNSNQLLKYLDYKLIKANPKIFCGYSDIDALNNALFAKTGLVTYSAIQFSTFGMIKGFEYSLEYFKKCLMQDKPFEIKPSKTWSDDAWWINQEKRTFIKNTGYWIINKGNAEGTILGGNLCTFNLLQGTEFMPNLKGAILFLEDDEDTNESLFDRDLQSVLHQQNFKYVKGLVIGRFQKKSKMTKEKLIKIIKTKKELDNIPIIANLDFGHSAPYISYPIGGKARLSVTNKVKLEVLEH
jgi:muramoyltetrapeptide carboxypeptidase